jgi:hypothetical protein
MTAGKEPPTPVARIIQLKVKQALLDELNTLLAKPFGPRYKPTA